MGIKTNTATVTSAIIWMLLSSQNHLAYTHGLDSTPERLITPGDYDVTLSLGTNYTLSCTSRYSITWKPFEEFTGKYEVSHESELNSVRSFKTSIHLIDVTHYYVGRFSCVYTDFMLNYRKGSESIYVYVMDDEHMLVYSDVSDIFGHKDDDHIIVPCKPTSRTIEVKLKRETEHVIKVSSDRVTYSPESGYKIAKLKEEDSGRYDCVVKWPDRGRFYVKTFYVSIRVQNNDNDNTKLYKDLVIDNNANNLKIVSATGYFGTQGEQLTLTCSKNIPKDKPIDLDWKLPNDNAARNENRVEHEVIKRKHSDRPDLEIVETAITITNVDIDKDTGIYECRENSNKDKGSWWRSDYISIRILRKDQGLIEIYDLQETVEPQGQAIWRVRYKGYPKPTLMWYDTFGTEISSGISNKYEVNVTNDFVTLQINQLSANDSGIYTLKAFNELIKTEKEFTLNVAEPSKPKIEDTNPKDAEITVLPGKTFEMFCSIIGWPDPSVNWYKNDKLIRNVSRITISADMKSLHINYVTVDDTGEYKCVGKNSLDSVHRSLNLKLTIEMPKLSSTWVIGVIGLVLLILVFVICTIYFSARFRRERRRLRELEAAGLINFEEGNPNGINPDLTLDQQADLLPYDKGYEFPSEQLQLGKQLGSGAFGVVMKGLAIGILPYEEETTVAVKMVKQTASNMDIKALVTELKIMIHLGHHLNVVNLLGAVTEDIAKRKLKIIVEYCRFGNLQNFLVKHRAYFVDQINPVYDSIDRRILSRPHELPSETVGYIRIDRPQEEGSVVSITTTDLVCWSFQVARGMEYLTSRRVLHGDLAARNILLCDDNVVKICDFGLSRSMYNSDIYKKQGAGPLPFKWLAVESISDQVFSTYSDVWSFGILMWELFSLGSVPYPGLDADENLYLRLKQGYRMDKPENATHEIYDIMVHCWNANPECRPLFSALEKRLQKLLDDRVAEHYIDLNMQYVELNANKTKEGKTDYLPFMTRQPALANEYVNTRGPKQIAAVSVYLPMEAIPDSVSSREYHFQN